jgi:hypothetical protein
MKIGLLATVNPQGLPHLTLIPACGQHAHAVDLWPVHRGHEQGHLRQNPTGRLSDHDPRRNLWRGKATFTHTARQGPSSSCITTSRCFATTPTLACTPSTTWTWWSTAGRGSPAHGPVVCGGGADDGRASWARRRGAGEAMNLWTQALLNKLGNLKFLAYVDGTATRCIVPVIQAQAANAGEVLFADERLCRGSDEPSPGGGPAAASWGMSLQMEDVLLRGRVPGAAPGGGQRSAGSCRWIGSTTRCRRH